MPNPYRPQQVTKGICCHNEKSWYLYLIRWNEIKNIQIKILYYLSPPFNNLNEPVIERCGSSPKYQQKSPVNFGCMQSESVQSKSGCSDFAFPPIKEDSNSSKSWKNFEFLSYGSFLTMNDSYLHTLNIVCI